MEIGLNNHLKKLSSDLFIKYDSSERKKINRSLDVITEKLTSHFGDEVDEIIVFGSYSRDTILPRTCDQNSDIDIMILYSNEYEKLAPESYRNQLRRFAEDNYRNSVVVKDHPSVVIELNHIKFDLVPAIFDKGFFMIALKYRIKMGDGWRPNHKNLMMNYPK